MISKSIFAILFFVAVIPQSNADTQNTMRVLSLSQSDGKCLTYQAMARFRDKNPTLAESEFIPQFMAAEAARDGQPSAMALWDRCQEINKTISKIFKQLEVQ